MDRAHKKYTNSFLSVVASIAAVLLVLLVVAFVGIFIAGRIYHRPVDVLYKTIDTNPLAQSFIKKFPLAEKQRRYAGGFGVAYRIQQADHDLVFFQSARNYESRLVCEYHSSSDAASQVMPKQEIISEERFKELLTKETLCEKDKTYIWIINDNALAKWSWPNGGLLVMMEHTRGSDDNNLIGTHVRSTNSTTYLHVKETNNNELLSPTQFFVHGEPITSNKNLQQYRSFFVTPEKITPVKQNEDIALLEISFSPTQRFIRFIDKQNSDDQKAHRFCIAPVTENTIEKCTNLKDLLPKTWEIGNGYFLDGDWVIDQDKYILIVRSSEEHDEVPSGREDASTIRVQKQVARFIYDPAIQELKEIGSEEQYQLKVSHKKGVAQIPYTDSGDVYEFKQSAKESTLDLFDPKTSNRAKLFDAYYMGKMPLFDLWMYQ